VARGDVVHFGLMLAAAVLAYVLPFELVLLSYAILGPAHYFTEISWLHDRGYHLPHWGFAIVLAVVALAAMFMASAWWLGVLLWIVFLGCALLAAVKSPHLRGLFGLAVVIVTFAMMAGGAPFNLVWVLLPTFIHVCIFTLVFMTLGAIKAKSRAQFALIGVYLVVIAVILAAPPSDHTLIPALARIGQQNWGGVAPALGALVGMPELEFPGRITGLLSFVYTYHYLNWFIKAEVVRWNRISRPRLVGVVALSAASTALYFWNYQIGLMVLLLISLLHVVLEFPLNALAIRQLGGAAFGRLRPAAGRV
jgi:hypothetical protein